MTRAAQRLVTVLPLEKQQDGPRRRAPQASAASWPGVSGIKPRPPRPPRDKALLLLPKEPCPRSPASARWRSCAEGGGSRQTGSGGLEQAAPCVPARTEHPAPASWSRGCSRGPGPTRGFPAFGSSRPLSISGRSGLLPGKPSARPGLAARRWGSHRGPPAATARHRRLFTGRRARPCGGGRRETTGHKAQVTALRVGRGLVRPQGRRRGPRPLRVVLRPPGQRLSCP